MAKGLRATRNKVNKARLRAKVFGPAENARKERLSAKLLKLASKPRPATEEDTRMQVDDEVDTAKKSEVDMAARTKPQEEGALHESLRQKILYSHVSKAHDTLHRFCRNGSRSSSRGRFQETNEKFRPDTETRKAQGEVKHGIPGLQEGEKAQSTHQAEGLEQQPHVETPNPFLLHDTQRHGQVFQLAYLRRYHTSWRIKRHIASSLEVTIEAIQVSQSNAWPVPTALHSCKMPKVL
ncbi:MAG: hypothetical protein Q9191_001862 [Dirinaria sp. TL-2023a]